MQLLRRTGFEYGIVAADSRAQFGPPLAGVARQWSSFQEKLRLDAAQYNPTEGATFPLNLPIFLLKQAHPPEATS
jgi:hypothetical protein